MGEGEALGKVTVSTNLKNLILDDDVITLYKFTGNNFSLGPDDIIYAQFRHGEEGIQKTIYIPIGTELYLSTKTLTVYWGDVKGFEFVYTPYIPAYRLVSDTGTLVISGHYD